MSTVYTLDIGISDHLHGRILKSIKPDSDGFYKVCVGALGVPSRSGKYYDTESMVAAMKDPHSAFYTQLVAGSLSGEYGHPVVTPGMNERDIIRRMSTIVESNMSHFFRRIWADSSASVNIDGFNAIPIYAEVKPTGPKGPILKEQLEESMHDTSFSMRTLAKPMGRNGNGLQGYLNLLVKAIITFDFVYAPGMPIASKRYVSHNESYNVSLENIEEALIPVEGSFNESYGINEHDINKLRMYEKVLVQDGRIVGTAIGGTRTIVTSGKGIEAASLIYRR